jgi:exopolysaccharide biosynthesis polyprenyl glycosylphosphotransferase
MRSKVATADRPRRGRPRGPAHLPSTSPGDIRAGRPYFLSPTPFRSAGRRIFSVASLVAMDVGALALGLYLALVLREVVLGRTPPLWGVLWEAQTEWLPFLTLITILVFAQADLYSTRERRAGIGRILSSLVVVAVVTFAFASAVGHHFNTYAIFPTAVALTAVLMGLFRASYDAITGELMRAVGVRRRAILVGNSDTLQRLHRALGSARGGISYDFVGAVSPADDGFPLHRLGDLESLPQILSELAVDELITTTADFGERELLEIVEQAHRRGVKVRVAASTAELLTQRAEYVPGQGLPLFELRPPVFAGTDWAVKRAFDLSVSVLVVLVGLPLWLLIALAIKLDTRGPIFYSDRRIGLNENEFGMFKFRTMYVGADLLQDGLEAENEASGALFKIRDDPRVTRVGRLLRRVSLDEIPQVLNVLRGQMSLVGPRPLPLRDFEQLEEWHRKRYLVLPGMTGLWQISGRSELTFDDLVRLDFYYLENWSIWLDVSVLAKTIPAVFGRRGAY